MVTTQGIVPRLAFKTHPDQAGIHRFVPVTDDARRDAPVVTGATKKSESTVLGWRFQVDET